MNVILNYLVIRMDAILEGIIIAIAGTACIALLSKIFVMIKKRFSSKSLPEPEDQAVYLNNCTKSLDHRCRGRKKLLKKVSERIKKYVDSSFAKKCIAIKGEEGIGKTLFCAVLFQDYLKKYPVYLGWIECNGRQSIFDIISNDFEDLAFWRKSKDKILGAFKSINKPCILFVDQVDQYTPINELRELSQCPNIILVLSGLLKEIDFVDHAYRLEPLPFDTIKKIFEEHLRAEIDLMDHNSRKSIYCLLENYVKGNPFLAIAFAKSIYHYDGKWENVLKNMQMREYNNENYLKKILRQLYKINQLEETEKSALSMLSTIQYTGFTKSVFKLLGISDQCAKTLCNTYWLAHFDRIIYSMDKAHCDTITKVLSNEINLKNSVNAISKTLSEYGDGTSNEFKWISSYIEDILKKIQGYAVHIMKEEYFYTFAYRVALNYKGIRDYKKCLEWIELCGSNDVVLSYEKSCLEFQAKYKFPNKFFSYHEIEQAYFEALEKAKLTNHFEYYKKFLMQEYCNFLLINGKYNDAISLCKKYFETYSMDLNDENSCVMFDRYLHVANLLDDDESLHRLVNEETIQALYQNEKVFISVAWSFWKISEIYLKWGYEEISEKYKRHMVILINEQGGFFNNYIRQELKISEEEFAEYMHSCDELRDSLNNALKRKDVDALYIEGRYQEKNGNYDAAFALYEAAAEQDSLRGICSLALLYYRGQGEACDYEKAHKYWEYCCERGHRGSYYWLAILLLDEDYKKKDKKSAIEYLTKAAELGSDRAKQKLQELSIDRI